MRNTNISERIKFIREKKNMTQSQLAAASNVDRSMISKIETGAANGSLDTLFKLAKALGVAVSCLLGDEPLEDESPKPAA